ncbi:hypothetical protein [Qingshengfaniella alkalisoli]|uniref:Uncharacterized protein n=1 Tax=Qingshengfaniella alkalisoli TaxID=2599296 RepID=A0A5B8I878_9RHOB|nr:hypothetical protein [Qingshengfaniella alkalisoli]QDY70145.1 hypothetical protein FPZ52_11270 [Qingshengfaniella alkalisoli]
MPDFDGGHLFLTFLTPIKTGSTTGADGTQMSYEQRLRMTLALLPTALQSPATQKIGENSPFARNRRTHLCRFMVLEDAIYNGRNPKNAIAMSVRGLDPINPGPVDRLNCGYLLFAADVDAVIEEGDALPKTLDGDGQTKARDAYARNLWSTMEAELRAVYGNCVGFDDVANADDFAAYLTKCQIETTMPFNDYWSEAPLTEPLPVKAMGIAAAVPAMIMLLGLFGVILGLEEPVVLGWLLPWQAHETFLWGLLVTALVVVGLYLYVLRRGQSPMPPGKYGDLPSVLKALYLQQNFADFVVDHQGSDAETLHRDFGAFLKSHRPDDKMQPSQAPGVISIHSDNAIIK